MSVSLLLVPLALAVTASVGAVGATGAVTASLSNRSDEKDAAQATAGDEVTVRTRMKNPTLLGAALEDVGALDVAVSGEMVRATVDGVDVMMSLTEQGVWSAHFAADDGRDVGQDEAAELVARLDAAYALRVQQAVAERIRTRADAAGFDLVSETRDADDTVTMVLNVKDYA
ncbi:hypothetical protein ACSAGD_14395 [Paramicrobacterium sp. CJ85]|uniref:hypothetical protein n=1 Tax=Paramicrobacterium sp. CJ85 TaxID=3445355 RepID=UPI003F613CBA